MATIIQWADFAHGWPMALQIAAGILIAVIVLIGVVVAGYTLVFVIVYSSIWVEAKLVGKAVGFLAAISLPLVTLTLLPLELRIASGWPWSWGRSPLRSGAFTGGSMHMRSVANSGADARSEQRR
jgi:hypothetical protein